MKFKWGLEDINKIRGLTMRSEGGGREEAVHVPEVGLIASLGLEKELKLVPSALEMSMILFYLAKNKVKSEILFLETQNSS